jgi:hypothetical protein
MDTSVLLSKEETTLPGTQAKEDRKDIDLPVTVAAVIENSSL